MAMKNGNGRTAVANGKMAAARRRISPEASPSPTSGSESRLPVLKTYKIFVGGKFPRTESGRYYVAKDAKGKPLANVCDCSRKDFRDAVVVARAAQGGWAGRTAYNRSQIIYRIAEMLEGRSAQFVEELVSQGVPAAQAKREVEVSIDRTLYYAGWADKYQQVFSSVNPVASSHFNFSVLEPTGIVSILCPENPSLLGILSTVIPAIVGGNVAIALASTGKPLAAVTLGEVLATSDLPGGVINLLTGRRAELVSHFSNHMDVNATVYCGNDPAERTTVRTNAALNVKRVVIQDRADWLADEAQSPYMILETQEVKTTWHPVGI